MASNHSQRKYMALGAPRVLGAVTPLGGLALIAGWLCVAAGGAATGARRGLT